MVYLLRKPYVLGKVEDTAKNDRGLADFPKLGIPRRLTGVHFRPIQVTHHVRTHHAVDRYD